MNKIKAMKWVKALRSGKYKQGTGSLKKVRGNTVTYCCLGVLGDISGIKSDILENMFYLGNELSDKCGLASSRGKSIDEDGDICLIKIGSGKKTTSFAHLAMANDEGASFEVIANWIEKNYKLL